MRGFEFIRWRFFLAIALLIILVLVMIGRLFDLNVLQRAFLLKQSDSRVVRSIQLPAYRGMILDRNGTPLAISTPMDSIWVNPKLFDPNSPKLTALAQLLQLNPSIIRSKVLANKDREFLYLEHDIPPALAQQMLALDITGVNVEQDYKRYYPEGEVASHVVGFTNINDQGQAGLELEYNNLLAGKPGEEKVVIDRLGHIIAVLKVITPAVQGKNLTLSIDSRLQFLAYQALKTAVQKSDAESGSIVVLDAKTGEILAMVNQPSFNPNTRPPDTDGRYRNRAVTDMYEPGSTIKPFTVSLALMSGKYTTETQIDTNPGWMMVGGYKISDDGLNHGVIDLQQLLQKSSNVGAAKVMLSLDPHENWQLLHDVGFGHKTASGFPGESPGLLKDRHRWYSSEVAALAYGYGIAVTALQLAHSYTILANNGLDVPVTFLKRTTLPLGDAVMPAKVAHEVLKMLQTVVDPGGTGTLAEIPGYQVAGKTGTAYMIGPHGYDKSKHSASFVGIAPVDNPRFVIAVVIHDPRKGPHFGGLISAPLFQKVMSGALRMYNVPPA